MAQLKKMPVFVYSTSFDQAVIDLLRENGANYDIRKPAKFSDLKTVINKALGMAVQKSSTPVSREEFVIQP